MDLNRIADVRAHVIKEITGYEGSWVDKMLPASRSQLNTVAPTFAENQGATGLPDVLIEVETEDGKVGFAIGQGGGPVCYIVERLLTPFLIGADPRDIALHWDRMFRNVTPELGRTGLAIMAISVVDLALWDLLGRLRDEPVYKLIGGATKDKLVAYHTGVRAEHGKALGFFATKLTLPNGQGDGPEGFADNLRFLEASREAVGPEYPIAIDCWQQLDVRYALDLARAVEGLDILWIEEPLHAEDLDGYLRLKDAMPDVTWTTGEHHYTRYGFRDLIAERAVDIIQPDLRWCGGLSEVLRIAAMAAAYDVLVTPHCGGVYSYHFAMAHANVPYVEYLNASANGEDIIPAYGGLVDGEPLPNDGTIFLSDEPGWGLTLNRDAAKLERPYHA